MCSAPPPPRSVALHLALPFSSSTDGRLLRRLALLSSSSSTSRCSVDWATSWARTRRRRPSAGPDLAPARGGVTAQRREWRRRGHGCWAAVARAPHGAAWVAPARWLPRGGATVARKGWPPGGGSCVQNVLDSLIPALLKDENRKFIYVEQSILPEMVEATERHDQGYGVGAHQL
ncbi:hypothetical protein ACP70R_018287 [Stipagrostis hirtigluma subsp. patula]